jgi:hypothetical protein
MSNTSQVVISVSTFTNSRFKSVQQNQMIPFMSYLFCSPEALILLVDVATSKNPPAHICIQIQVPLQVWELNPD